MYVNNAVETVSVYEPLHDSTCRLESLRNATVRQSAVERKCLLAVNAGMFNTTTGECLGMLDRDDFSVTHFIYLFIIQTQEIEHWATKFKPD